MKSLSLSVAMILAGAVSGIAGTSVWSFDKQKGNEMQPAYWYTYAQPTGETTGDLKDTEEGYKQFTTTLTLSSSEYGAAGVGLVWKQESKKDVPVDLSQYAGICLTYKAEQKFRVDFKQTSVTDYDFHGIYLDAQDEFASKFIDFQNLSQEGWGAKVALDLKNQEAIQINYKTGIANDLANGAAKNVITISAISLGDCESTEIVVPDTGLRVLEPYDKLVKDSIAETDSLKIDLKKVFAAGEGETATITVMAPLFTVAKPTGAISLTDEIVLAPKAIEKDTSGVVRIVAVSGTNTFIVQLSVKITDKAAGPVGPTCPGDPDCPDDPPPEENHPTTVLAPYNVDAVTLDTLLETDTLRLPLAKLFADEDNDKIIFVIETSAPFLKNLTLMDKATLNDTLAFITSGVKKDTTVVLAISATDGKSDLVKVQFVVPIKDVNLSLPPVAVNIEYDALEDTPLSVSMANNIMSKCSDPDGDDFLVVQLDSTKHGKVTSFTQYGTFIYTPKANFYGDDTLSYTLVETANHSMVSNKGKVIIHVKPVNDKPGFVVVDSTFLKDTLTLDMDFDEDTVKQIKISTEALVFGDEEVNDGSQKLTYKALGTKIVAAVDSVNASFYFISVKPVLGASGLATIFFYASDGIDSVGLDIPVKLVSPKDVAQALADEYTAFNDTVLIVSAKEGVLANDKYPEGVTKGMEAELAQKPAHGTLVLEKDGSFKYTPTANYEGVDIFGYYDVINGTKSKAAIVTISVEKRNLTPTVVVKTATLDTTVSEDFPTSKALKYPQSTIASWFKDPEGDSLTYSAKSKDGKLKVEITEKGMLEINSVADSTGKAYVVVTATDKKSGSKSFEFCVTIKAVNDKPIVLHPDTMFVGTSDWSVRWDLDTLVTDVDGDELTYSPNETSALTKYMTLSMKGSVLTVKSIEGLKYTEGKKYAIGVKATDEGGLNVTVPLYIVIDKVRSGLVPTLVQPKNTWQNAVMAKRGSVSIMDMQGRKIWSAKLPVNPAEVKKASAQVQGRKILRVNNQTWTIK